MTFHYIVICGIISNAFIANYDIIIISRCPPLFYSRNHVQTVGYLWPVDEFVQLLLSVCRPTNLWFNDDAWVLSPVPLTQSVKYPLRTLIMSWG